MFPRKGDKPSRLRLVIYILRFFGFPAVILGLILLPAGSILDFAIVVLWSILLADVWLVRAGVSSVSYGSAKHEHWDEVSMSRASMLGLAILLPLLTLSALSRVQFPFLLFGLVVGIGLDGCHLD
jgi:hypothetical protein